ncbi:MAG: hyaD 2 [Verrucomicrobia bacterium]|nr:hyaD 2 [Verrucomicrobiota bacterium]
MNPEIHIDAPAGFSLPSRFLRMRGWCFGPGSPYAAMRLSLGGREFFGRCGIYRPDVRLAFPAAPDDFTGFELWAIIPAGKHPAELQFKDAAGQWRTALETEISVPAKWQPLWAPDSRARDLVEFQLGARPSHGPHPVILERFPSLRTGPESRPAFSIVTPSFNQCRYLGEALDSVLGQQDVRFSYVVQDGGSTDGSTDVLQQRAAKLAAWESTRDAGQADAIAKGFARTDGEPDDLMAWLNSDDVYLPGTLAYVSGYFSRHPEVDVVYGQRILIDENSQEVGRWFLPPHDDEMLKLNDYVPQESLFWRRRIWDRVGGIDPAFRFAMDWDLLLRFQKAGARIVRVPYFLACFRIHAAQKTSAQMESLGHREIDALRTQAQGRALTHAEVEEHPRLLRYLRQSAWREFLWRRFHLRGS